MTRKRREFTELWCNIINYHVPGCGVEFFNSIQHENDIHDSHIIIIKLYTLSVYEHPFFNAFRAVSDLCNYDLLFFSVQAVDRISIVLRILIEGLHLHRVFSILRFTHLKAAEMLASSRNRSNNSSPKWLVCHCFVTILTNDQHSCFE